ncbi:MAG: hypothetical protein ACXW4H_04350 [Candidatus Limnocylindrales bacterium]
MTERGAGPAEVRPNTLQGQSVPNTFRSDAGSGTGPRQYLNSGGGNTAPPTRLSIPAIPVRALVVLAVVLIVVGLYLLNGTP